MSQLFIYGRTSGGNKTLMYQGYEYLKHRTTASSVTHWRCVKRRSNNCRSIMHTMGDEVVQNPGEHTCNETTSQNQLVNSDISTYSFEIEELSDSTEQLDATYPTIQLLVQEVPQSPLKKNLSIQEKNTFTEEPERTHKGVRTRTQELVQAQLEENVTSEQLLTPPVKNEFNSQLVHNELEVAAINIKQEMLTEQSIILELVEEKNIKAEEFNLQNNNSQGLAEDGNFPPTPVSSRKRRGSIESFDEDELFNIRSKVAKLDLQIKEKELNLVSLKTRNEKQCHQLRKRILLNLLNNL
ncbi:uncharacterized protein LOC126266024 [Aethina tumida]|uniref:uncharacterized protein LOC126266024 n=1 Tax=Aethina tumida TaxID=116153 RepID=UPI0021495067|nr:uncharacterized protein LOC126266024 [Aethina tumida]